MLYVIKDNVLPDSEYMMLSSMLISEGAVPWFYSHTQTTNMPKDTSYFWHVLFDNHKVRSDLFDSFQPLLHTIGCESLINLRLNLTVARERGYSNIHCDEYSKSMNHKTAIFYIGTNNGKTILKLPSGDLEVDSVDNRILIFDSNILHCAKHQTDEDIRIVANINYFGEFPK